MSPCLGAARQTQVNKQKTLSAFCPSVETSHAGKPSASAQFFQLLHPRRGWASQLGLVDVLDVRSTCYGVCSSSWACQYIGTPLSVVAVTFKCSRATQACPDLLVLGKLQMKSRMRSNHINEHLACLKQLTVNFATANQRIAGLSDRSCERAFNPSVGCNLNYPQICK